MDSDELQKLQDRIRSLSDEELLTMVEDEAADYRQEALAIAETELVARGLDFKPGPVEETDEIGEETDEELAAEPAVPAPRRAPPPCSVCGDETCFGILFAGRELTFLYPEENREGVVEAFACRNCGRIQLILDWETDVQRDER